MAQMAPVVVSACESEDERREAIKMLLALIESRPHRKTKPFPMNGASVAADQIAALARAREQLH